MFCHLVQLLKVNRLESEIKTLNLQNNSDSCFHNRIKRVIHLLISQYCLLKSIFITSGEKESGKTTFLIDIIALLEMNGFVARRFRGVHDIESDCYQIKDVKTNEASPLMQRVASFEKHPHHFKFFPEGVEMGNSCIKELLIHHPDIAVVDEIGGFELRGKLWSSSFTQLIDSSIPLIFSVKDRLLDKVLSKWNIEPTHVFSSADFSESDKAFKRIESSLRE